MAASASRGVPVYAPAIADAHCAYPRRDGQAELTFGGWLHIPGHIRHLASKPPGHRVSVWITVPLYVAVPRVCTF